MRAISQASMTENINQNLPMQRLCHYFIILAINLWLFKVLQYNEQIFYSSMHQMYKLDDKQVTATFTLPMRTSVILCSSGGGSGSTLLASWTGIPGRHVTHKLQFHVYYAFPSPRRPPKYALFPISVEFATQIHVRDNREFSGILWRSGGNF